MSTGKKVLNIFGIIFAWLLSITLVILLFVAPMLMSTMSTITPKNLVHTVQNIALPEFISALGDDVIDPENQQLAALLATDAAQELYETYIASVLGVLDSDLPQEALTEEKLQDIVHRHIDELYTVFLSEYPELANFSEAEAKQQLEAALVAGFHELTANLPSGETLKQELAADPTMETVLDALMEIDVLKLSFVLTIVILSGLIFVCRLFGFRGFRWLSVDLFVASGISGLICVGLTMGSTAVGVLAIESPVVGLLAGKLMSTLVLGAYIRTAIMLVAAVLLLIAYLLIKKALAKKAAPTPTPQPADPAQIV